MQNRWSSASRQRARVAARPREIGLPRTDSSDNDADQLTGKDLNLNLFSRMPGPANRRSGGFTVRRRSDNFRRVSRTGLPILVAFSHSNREPLGTKTMGELT